FLIVPGLMLATGMPILNAIGSSLVAVAAFGFTSAANYAVSGFVDWRLAAVFLAGGVVGGLAGAALAKRLADKRATHNVAFASVVSAARPELRATGPGLGGPPPKTPTCPPGPADLMVTPAAVGRTMPDMMLARRGRRADSRRGWDDGRLAAACRR